MMNVCAETYPLNSASDAEWNPFVGMDDKTETEYYDPYVFPAIVEKETETEQTSSFSVECLSDRPDSTGIRDK